MTSTRNSEPTSPRPRVLVIDDDEIALEAIREVLDSAGFEVHCLGSPIGATHVIVTQGIEAVVVDLNMPVMSGDRFISLLRSWDRIRDLPAILISESSQAKLDGIAGILSEVQTVTKSNMRSALPLALRRVLAKERSRASMQAGAGEASPEEQRRLARAAQACSKLLSSMNSGRQQDWAPFLQELRMLRDRARSVAPPLLKLVSKTLDTAESCARRHLLSPEARLALRGTLELVAQPETISPNNLQSLQSIHLSRLQRACDEVEK